MNKKLIVSPMSGDITLQKRLQDSFNKEGIEDCLFLYVNLESNLILTSKGFCVHELKQIGELITEKAEELLEEDDCEEEEDDL